MTSDTQTATVSRAKNRTDDEPLPVNRSQEQVLRDLADNSTIDLEPPAGVKKRRSRLIGGIGALSAIGVVIAGIFAVAISERETTLRSTIESRLNALGQGKAEVVDTWLNGINALGDRFASSEYIKLFAFETALATQDPVLRATLADQRPYMQQVIDEFAETGELTAAALVASDGGLLIASRGFSSDARDNARNLLGAHNDVLRTEDRQSRVFAGPLRLENGRPQFELAVMVNAPQSINPALAAPKVGAIVMTVDASSIIRTTLEPETRSAPGERRWLSTQGMSISLADGKLRMTPLPANVTDWPELPENGGKERDSFDGQSVFAASHGIDALAWTIVSEQLAYEAMLPLERFRTSSAIVASSLTALLALVMLSLWWRQASKHSDAMASQYKDLAQRINNHKQLLEKVASTIPDIIWLKMPNGTIVWANKAFSKLYGRSEFDAASLDGAAAHYTEKDLFGAGSRELIEQTDRMAVYSGQARIEEKAMELAGNDRIVSLAKMPIANSDGGIGGIVGVARDVTEQVQLRHKREKLIRQTVNALVRSVELVDPYLLGHTKRLQDLSFEIGVDLECTPDEKTTLELAAGLSQIGKIFIPRDILTKPERHTAEEIAIMKTHIEHTLSIIEGVEFELPVSEAIAQMYERLDGTGYPNGLRGDQISKLARILAVADVFCARTSPRSYREVIDHAEVIGHLRSNGDRYDIQVVESLNKLKNNNAQAAQNGAKSEAEQEDAAPLQV